MSDRKKTRVRTELTQDEVKIKRDVVAATIKNDFLTSDVSYQKHSELKCLADYRRSTDKAVKKVNQILKGEFGATSVSVGNGLVAVVKRKD